MIIMNEIDVKKCPHFLIKEGGFDDGEYIDNADACKLSRFTPWGDTAECYHVCNCDCDWYLLQQLKAENKKLKIKLKNITGE